MSSIVLYHFPISHYSEKIRWALDYKGIAHKKVTLLPGLHIKKMKKVTGQSSVPVLEHNGKYFYNSSDILDYLDNTFPDQPLTPENTIDAKAVIEWEQFVDRNIGPQVRVLMYHHLLKSPEIVTGFFTHEGPFYGPMLMKIIFPKMVTQMRRGMKINSESALDAQIKLERSIKTLNSAMAGRDFLVGNSFTRADLSAAALLAPLIMPKAYGLNKPELPSELQTILDTLVIQIPWVERLYQDHR